MKMIQKKIKKLNDTITRNWEFENLKWNSPESLVVIELNDVPLREPLVAEELCHVVSNGIRQDDDALLTGRQLGGRVNGHADGRAGAAAAQHSLVANHPSGIWFKFLFDFEF